MPDEKEDSGAAKDGSELKQAPPATAAVSAARSPTLAEAMVAVETLVQIFGFDVDVANLAVNEVGTDVNQCCNYILENGLGKDVGGAVYPIDNCPHLEARVQVRPGDFSNEPPLLSRPCCYNQEEQPRTGNLKGETSEDGSCPVGENWICLQCNKIFCSRYVNGHGLQHWKDTQAMEEKTENKNGANEASGHCLAASLADLSVWCHTCRAYLIHDDKILKPIMTKLEQLKFSPTDV